MSNATKIRRSQATFLQFDADRTFTPAEFYLICLYLALQADPCESKPLTALQWMLAYWRAAADDLSRHDRAGMFFYGRDGFGGEDWDTTLAELINQMTDEPSEEDLEIAISAENVNTLIQWAFDRFINWAPEPTPAPDPTLLMKTSSLNELLLKTTSLTNMLAQFTDHFEEYETLALAQFLVERREVHPDLWLLLTSGGVNIDVQYGVGPTDDTRSLVINGGRWMIHYTEDADIGLEGPNGFSTKE